MLCGIVTALTLVIVSPSVRAQTSGFDFGKVPPVLRTPTPRAAWFGIAPTGPGYYSALDYFRNLCRDAAPKFPYPATVNASLSAFDLDYKYVDDPKYAPDAMERLKRIKLGDHWIFSTGGQAWLRYENQYNARLGNADNIFLLDRVRPYVDLWYEDKFRLFAEGMFAASTWQDLRAVPNDVDHNDIQNLFVDLKTFTWADHAVYARVGRQELALGGQRLLATPDWVNARQTFDGVRLLRNGEKWNSDVFWLSPRIITDPNNLNSHDNNINLFGAWATYKVKPGTSRDLFLVIHDNTNLFVQQGIRMAPFTSYTFGSRAVGDIESRFLYEFEVALQLGTKNRQEIIAGYTTAGLGYRCEHAPGSPIVWAYYDYCSGDDTPNGGASANTVNRVYPFGHYYGGWVDVVGRQNIHDLSFAAWLYPSKWTSIWIQYHNFWLASAKDALYNAAGAAIRRDATGCAGSYVGQEIDVLMNFHLTKRADLQVGYSYLWGGDYLRKTASAANAVNTSLCSFSYGYRW